MPFENALIKTRIRKCTDSFESLVKFILKLLCSKRIFFCDIIYNLRNIIQGFICNLNVHDFAMFFFPKSVYQTPLEMGEEKIWQHIVVQ